MTSLEISGRAFDDTPSPFNRLPKDAKATVRAPVWDLGWWLCFADVSSFF
jgi:hypothetical protein